MENYDLEKRRITPLMKVFIPDNVMKAGDGLSKEDIDKYLDSVWNFCDQMKEGEIIEVKQKAKKHPELFVECVKDYILNHEYGAGISFSSDFEKVKKCAF